MYQLSKPTQELIKKYEDWNRSSEPKENTSTIHVDEVASKLAVFYEKIRGIIDWKEEHLLRTGAIERTLKRKIFSKLNINTGNFSNENVAEPFVFELIRGGIFPNDKIEESKIQAIQKILDKYIHIINNSPQDMPRIRLCNWILSIAACEIEEAMGESEKENALIDFMFQFLKEKIAIKGMSEKAALSGEEINIQLYIATQRALFKLDSPAISYRLIKYKYKDWSNIAEDKILLISKDIYAVQEKIEKDLNHFLADKFYKVCEKYDAPFLLLGDIISENQKEIREKLSDPKALEILARKAYALRLKGLSRRLKRAAIYATISIFVTKILLALAVEIPLDKYIFGNFNFLAIGIDALFPPLLMFILIATIKPPREGNFNVLLLELIKIVFLQKNN
ncbi:MAG: hypothetical protein Q8N69_00730, partial [bacterium]|nr:hypothetical protein [bacterium]